MRGSKFGSKSGKLSWEATSSGVDWEILVPWCSNMSLRWAAKPTFRADPPPLWFPLLHNWWRVNHILAFCPRSLHFSRSDYREKICLGEKTKTWPWHPMRDICFNQKQFQKIKTRGAQGALIWLEIRLLTRELVRRFRYKAMTCFLWRLHVYRLGAIKRAFLHASIHWKHQSPLKPEKP